MYIRENNTAGVIAEANEMMSAHLGQFALEIVVEAKRIVPVDTGRLQRSIHAEVDVDKGMTMIGSSVHYAPYVEMGTSKMRAQPYLRPALEMVANRWKGRDRLNIAEVAFTARGSTEAQLQQLAQEVVREAKRIVPFRTGRLQKSIHAEVDVPSGTVTVGSSIYYAPYVEITKPYLRPAFETVQRRRFGG